MKPGRAFHYGTRFASWAVILVALAAAFGAALVRGGAVEWFVCALLLAVALTSGLLPVLSIAGIQVSERSGTPRERIPSGVPNDRTGNDAIAYRGIGNQPVIVASGQDTVVELVLTRALPLPLTWLAVEDGGDHAGGGANRRFRCRALLIPGFRKQITFSYSVSGLGRGTYVSAPLRLCAGDWLGLTAIQRMVPRQQEWLILPAEAETGDPEKEDSRASDNRAGQPAAYSAHRLRQIGEEGWAWQSVNMPAGIGPDSRPFRPEDSPRYLDARAAARGRGMFTRLAQPETPSAAWIAIDAFIPERDGQRNDLLLDGCIGSALKAAREGLISSTVHVCSSRWRCELVPGQTREMEDMLHLMARMEPDADKGGAFLTEICAELGAGERLAVFSADWESRLRWGDAADMLAEHGGGLTLYFAIDDNGITTEMIKQQDWLEGRGMRVYWLHPGKRAERAVMVTGVGGLAYAAG
ncbi:DUF58 domain-containing protein [Paenibacillus sp. CAU 1782]